MARHLDRAVHDPVGDDIEAVCMGDRRSVEMAAHPVGSRGQRVGRGQEGSQPSSVKLSAWGPSTTRIAPPKRGL